MFAVITVGYAGIGTTTPGLAPAQDSADPTQPPSAMPPAVRSPSSSSRSCPSQQSRPSAASTARPAAPPGFARELDRLSPGDLVVLVGDPAIVAYANRRASDSRINNGYSTLFALAILVKIVCIQLIVGL